MLEELSEIEAEDSRQVAGLLQTYLSRGRICKFEMTRDVFMEPDPNGYACTAGWTVGVLSKDIFIRMLIREEG